MTRILLGAAILLSSGLLVADEPAQTAQELRDDATLHDVQFIGSHGWACGDRGAFWRTDDGGATWDMIDMPVDASYESLCFLTDRIGWVVGGTIEPWSRTQSGVVLFTSDGGKTWKNLENNGLPVIHAVRFFSMEHGIALGARMSTFGTGVLTTQDGGVTWQEAEGQFSLPWRTAEFVTPKLGVLASADGSTAVWGGEKLLLVPMRSKTIRDFSIDRKLTGWMVGDGATVMRTTNGGAGWKPPAGDISRKLRDAADFRCVAHVGSKVWIAGSPGSCVWHSPDNGVTWQIQRTGETVPIESIHFNDALNGWAVGDMGVIRRTVDGGRTWQTVRGNARRAGLLVVAARPSTIPVPALVQLSKELGYRSSVIVPAFDETGQTASTADDFDLYLNAAAVFSGAAAGTLGHRLPIGVPDAQINQDRLLSEWNQRTDGRLQEVLFTSLVSQIRTWRPDVILLDRGASDDQTTHLINQAVEEAVAQAADSTRHLDLVQFAALEPWHVRRVYERLPQGESGTWKLRKEQPLPRTGRTLDEEARAAYSLLFPRVPQLPDFESYELVLNRAPQFKSIVGDLFAGIALRPGSDARRELAPLDETMLSQQGDSERRRKRFLVMIDSTLESELNPARSLALLGPHLAKMNADEGSRHLLEIAERYLEFAEWDAAEGTLIELVNRYPDQPAGQAGMVKLLELWTSLEVAWQRSSHVGMPFQQVAVNKLAIQKLLENPKRTIRGSDIYDPETTAADPAVPSIVQTATDDGDPHGARMRAAAIAQWQNQAGALGVALWSRNRALAREPEVQFALTTVAGNPQIAQRMEQLLRKADPETFGPGMTLAAWLGTPRDGKSDKAITAVNARVRPTLDAVLSDRCWQDAQPIALGRDEFERDNPNQSLVMFAWDEKYLYIAGSFLKAAGVPMTGPQTAGREYDRDLAGHDRVSFAIDLDGDPFSNYELTIDERGWTQETCLNNRVWNPDMFIAVDADDTHWRIEAAIALKDLAPLSMLQGNGWNLAVSRTIPGLGWQNWTGKSAQIHPQPDNFGTLRFR